MGGKHVSINPVLNIAVLSPMGSTYSTHITTQEPRLPYCVERCNLLTQALVLGGGADPVPLFYSVHCPLPQWYQRRSNTGGTEHDWI